MGQPWQAEPDADGEEARALRPLVVPHGPEVPEQATDAAVAAECEVLPQYWCPIAAVRAAF
jgi:hypothetical protein